MRPTWNPSLRWSSWKLSELLRPYMIVRVQTWSHSVSCRKRYGGVWLYNMSKDQMLTVNLSVNLLPKLYKSLLFWVSWRFRTILRLDVQRTCTLTFSGWPRSTPLLLNQSRMLPWSSFQSVSSKKGCFSECLIKKASNSSGRVYTL